MSRIYSRITRVASWAGWCSPCQREDRPLVLTRSGPGGLRSWLAGTSDEDRVLLLTCRVCGGWQFVPRREEDDPEVLLVDDPEVPVDSSLVVPAPRGAELPPPVEDVLPGELVAGLMAEISAVAQDAEHAPPPPLTAPIVPAPRAAEPEPAPVTLPAFCPQAVAGTQAGVVSALSETLGLPAGTRQVVLALAS